MPTRLILSFARSVNRHLVRTIGTAVIVVAAALRPVAAGAQVQTRAPATGPDTTPAPCFGFVFGGWTPRLDWRAAGHGEQPNPASLSHAPSGRDWATDGLGGRDSVLMLYPVWWPAGVSVELPTMRPAFGDTIVGRATALVSGERHAARVHRAHARCRLTA